MGLGGGDRTRGFILGTGFSYVGKVKAAKPCFLSQLETSPDFYHPVPLDRPINSREDNSTLFLRLLIIILLKVIPNRELFEEYRLS